MGSSNKTTKAAAANAKAARKTAAINNKYVAGTLAIAVARSMNSKIGDAATTYAEQRSCPESCVFFAGGGCYAEQGRLGQYTTAPLNAAAKKVEATPEQIAAYEAMEIDGLKIKQDRPLRLHTVGDCKTDKAANLVAAASGRYVKRGGGPAWTYTHAWRDVERESWRDVNVLASCEKPKDVTKAHARGYATAIVVEEFASTKRYQADGITLLPCPAQTKPNITCADCRLCMNAPRLLRDGLTIAFEVHGTGSTQRHARLALTDPDNPNRKKSSRVLIPRFIRKYRKKYGRAPKNSLIAKALGINPSSVSQMRKRLAEEQAAQGDS